MNMRIVCILVISIHAAFFEANAEMNSPAYPPQQWRLSVTFYFSRDVLLTFLDSKPGKSDFFTAEMLNLWLSDDCEIRGSSTHAVLTRELAKDGLGGRSFEAVGYVPQVDQAAIYSNACEVLQAFRFTDSFIHTNFDASGIDISVDLKINGRSMSVKYDKVQAKDGLPADVASLFALLRRSLPASYNRLFDYLRVSRLPDLTGDVASQYRRCQVHHEWMKVGEVRIAYGFLSPEKAYSEARKKFFPNAHLYSAGGCVVTPDSPRTEKTLYCELCRKAEAEWQKKNGNTPNRGTPK